MKELYKSHLGNGIVLWEEGDNGDNFKGYISPQREVRGLDEFTPDNQIKIKALVKTGNMIVGNDGCKYLALNPLNKPTEEYINKTTGEVYKISIETIDGTDYKCIGSQVFKKIIKRITVRFSHDESRFCYDVYKVLKIEGTPPKNKKEVCRMNAKEGVSYWYSYTGEEPDSPLKEGLVIEIINSDGTLTDKIVNGKGTLKLPMSWEEK